MKRDIEFTADMVKPLREKLGMTQQEFAQEIGAGIRTVANWESQKQVKMIRSLRMNCIKLAKRVQS